MKQDWHCIAFTRTVGWEARDREDDELEDYAGLVAWAVGRGLVSSLDGEDLLGQARSRPVEAERTLVEARALRALIYQVLRRVGQGLAPDAGRLEALNGWVGRFGADRRLALTEGGVEWSWQSDPYGLDGMLAPLVWDVAELLTSRESGRLRLCDGDDCGWLFIDASRNRSRRWCDMSDCGNRAKARRFRERQREEG